MVREMEREGPDTRWSTENACNHFSYKVQGAFWFLLGPRSVEVQGTDGL